MRALRDRDFVETPEGFFACVVGYLHPPDKVISYVKYVPHPTGKWGRDEKRYERLLPDYAMPTLLENIRALRESHPQYVFYSDVLNTTMSCCPLNRVKKRYHPEEKLHELEAAEALDPLQQKALSLASTLSEASGVPLRFFGVTGSILIDIHRPEFSDIDLTIYGRENALRLRETCQTLHGSKRSPIQRLSGTPLERWCENKARLHPLTKAEAKMILGRKWNRGAFEDTFYSLHPIRLDQEITETYGDRLYKPEGIATIKATVTDASQALFLPSTYRVQNAKVLEGPREINIKEVTTYEGLYGDILQAGEDFVARGKVERVLDKKSGDEYHRLFIGSAEAVGQDYIKPIS
ncbi:MAG: hypothetical protein ACE5GD_02880 [Candidatus Geothermarchaeales archaeon]